MPRLRLAKSNWKVRTGCLWHRLLVGRSQFRPNAFFAGIAFDLRQLLAKEAAAASAELSQRTPPVPCASNHSDFKCNYHFLACVCLQVRLRWSVASDVPAFVAGDSHYLSQVLHSMLSSTQGLPFVHCDACVSLCPVRDAAADLVLSVGASVLQAM